MVPNVTAEGTSFYGAFLYYFHDKEERTRNRIGFTETINMLTDKVEKAWKVMAYTAKNAAHLKRASGQVATGAKLKKSVFAYSLSWHPEQNPSKEAMLEAAKDSLAALGLSEHEAMIAEHTDEPHPHIHIMVNKVHPLTGLVAKLKYSKDKLSKFAYQLERKEGKMYCQKREENYAKREQNQKTKYINPVIQDAWQTSQNGADFKANLENSGYQIARGDRCIVIVDPKGKPQSAARALNLKTKDFKERLGAAEITNLKSFEQAKQDIKNRATQQPQQVVTQSADHQQPIEEFEATVAEALNGFFLKSVDETAELSERHNRKIQSKRDELHQFYSFDKTREEIDGLQHKLQRGGLFQRILGLQKHREHKLNTLKAGLQNAQERFDEAVKPLEKEKLAALEELKKAQAEKLKTLKSNFDRWRPSLPKEKPERAPEPRRTLQRHHGRNAPELER